MAAVEVDSIPVEPIQSPTRDFQYTFPPFPTPPPGVKIIPFKDFKEYGIRFQPGPGDEEVDGLGIPTIPMTKAHSNNVCKTNTKRKRENDTLQARKKADKGNRLWWEQWDEGEFNRYASNIDPASPPAEKLRAASNDFASGRFWPTTFASETGPKFIWEKFQKYVGLSDGNLVRKAGKKQGTKGEVHEVSDDEDDEELAILAERNADHIEIDKSAVESLPILDIQAMVRENRLTNFLDDPVSSVSIFLSSYAWSEGYVWSDPNLDCMPRVIHYFLNFLIRVKVAPERNARFKKAAEIAELAIRELPRTSIISKGIPDQLSEALVGLWGSRLPSASILLTGIPPDAPSEEEEEAPSAAARIVEIVDETKPSEEGSGWGASSSTGGWGGGNDDTPEGWNADWLTELEVKEDKEDKADDPWTAAVFNVVRPSIFSFFGPTTLSLTHSPGVVERSARVIKSITFPQNVPPPPDLDVWQPNVRAIELGLEELCVKVVLGPMPEDWDGGEAKQYRRPCILSTSQGAVIDPDSPSSEPHPEGTKAHDPLKDEITVFLLQETAAAKSLCLGMALAGTFVQLARALEPPKKKKKSKSSKKTEAPLWYLEELMMVIPSFWSIPTPSPA